MRLIETLDHVHAEVVRNRWLQRFTVMTRLLLAIAFIPSGLVKVLNIPFTTIGPDQPIGYFFDALYQSGAYYNFIGWGQVIAAALLLIPATASLGALVYFPIVLNITIITHALHFTGTPVITTLMLLGSTYLLCWEYDKLKPFLPRLTRGATAFSSREYLYEALVFGVLGVIGFGLLAALRISNMYQLGILGAVAAGFAGAVFGLVLTWHLRRAFRTAETPTEPSSPAGHGDRRTRRSAPSEGRTLLELPSR